jgi:hypothetical protein
MNSTMTGAHHTASSLTLHQENDDACSLYDYGHLCSKVLLGQLWMTLESIDRIDVWTAKQEVILDVSR